MPAVGAGAVDDVGVTVEDGLQQAGEVGGVVFEVGVEDGEQRSARLADASPQRRALALVLGLADETGRVRSRLRSLMVSRQPSVEPSSTTRISVVIGIVTASRRSRAIRSVSRSLYTGITIVRLWWFMWAS